MERDNYFFDFDCVDFIFEPNHKGHSLKQSANYMFFLTIDDGITLYKKSEKIVLKGKSFVFIRKGDYYRFENATESPAEAVYFCIKAQIFEEYLSKLSIKESIKWSLDQKKSIILKLSNPETIRIRNEILSLNKYMYNNELRNSYAEYLVSFFMVKVFSVYPKYKSFDDLSSERISNYMLTKLSEIITKPELFSLEVKELAEWLHCSTRSFSRLIHKYFGISPNQYLTNVRMRYVAQNILSSDRKINDLLIESGYNNVSWGIKLFKQYYGLTPKQYQKVYKDKINKDFKP